ncbi:MAG TPA: hypothetical protein VIK65_11415 [Candidatus Limnocylindrales bacterium]
MTDVSVLILHPEAAERADEIERWVAAARASLAERHRIGFLRAGATDATIVAGVPDEVPFGARLRTFVERRRPGGVVVLGSGAIPLATARDRRDLVAAAGRDGEVLANNRFSADVIAIGDAGRLRALPDLRSDNALPRWLAEEAGFAVHDLRDRWRLGFDVDGPLDLVLLGHPGWVPAPPALATGRVEDRLRAVRDVARDRTRELVIAGRLSAAALAWAERSLAARTRAIIEERGFRTAPADQRGPRSLLGALLDRDGPRRIGERLAELGDAALVDTRVLVAHRYGSDEWAWPSAADRFSSDLLLPDRIADPWLRELTAGAADADIPIVLGGHTLVGPGLRLALGGTRSWS